MVRNPASQSDHNQLRRLPNFFAIAPESRPESRIAATTLRVRRHRERRREGLRWLTLEMPETAIDAAIARGFLKPEDSTQAWSGDPKRLRHSAFREALNWLTDNGVITTEQRTNPVAILRCISAWLEGRPKPIDPRSGK